MPTAAAAQNVRALLCEALVSGVKREALRRHSFQHFHAPGVQYINLQRERGARTTKLYVLDPRAVKPQDGTVVMLVDQHAAAAGKTQTHLYLPGQWRAGQALDAALCNGSASALYQPFGDDEFRQAIERAVALLS